jgi:hypothetical protein
MTFDQTTVPTPEPAPAPAPEAPAAAPEAEAAHPLVGQIVKYSWTDPTGAKSRLARVVSVNPTADHPEGLAIVEWLAPDALSGPISADSLEVQES